MIGRTLSHYTIVDQIGAGGMGVVYRARDTLLERFVALKFLPADAIADESRQRRFLQEARAASALNHPHIVTIYDVVRADDVHAIVMELVEGTSLRARIATGPLPVPEALVVARQIADALSAAHAAGIVHRDLKPANVMITERGSVKVLDFGIAKLDPLRADDATRTGAMTAFGLVLGTAEYMSPEQARGESVDARADVFSLGVVTYEMLSARSPFAAATITGTLHKLIYEPPPDLSTSGVEMPPGLAAVVDRALAKKPEGRFPDMAAFGSALDDVIAGRPMLAPAPARDNPPEVSRRPGPRRRILAALSIVAILVAAAWGSWRAGWLSRLSGGPAEITEAALPQTPYEAYRVGQSLLERYDRDKYIDRSIEHFRRAVDLKSDYPAAFAGLGMAYWRKYRDQRDPMWLKMADENARRAVDLDPQLTIGQVGLAFVNIEKGELAAAEKRLADAVALDPTSADVFAAVAFLKLTQRDIPGALDAVRKGVALRPKDWSLSLMEGVILITAGRHAEAVPPLERAAGLAPDSALVYRNLGGAYHALGRYADATTSFQRALEIKADPAVYNNLGTLYFFRGLYDQAIVAFERAVQLRANDFRTWANLADAYRFTPGRKTDAEQAYTRALQLLDEQMARAPNDLDLSTRRVVMLAKKGDCTAAKTGAAAAQDAASRSSAAVYRLAVAHEVCGDRAQALEAVTKAVTAGYPLEQVHQDPELVDLRADIRFHRFLSARRPGSTQQP
jgi:eukaryotic-like serine/threonine-protein kinase